MNPEAPLSSWQTRLSRRIALAACPPRERPWVEALFAELDVIDGAGPRFAWVMGAACVVATRSGRRAAAPFSGRFHFVVLLALWFAFLSGAISLTGYEGLGVDDDLFLAFAAALGAAAAGLWARALRQTPSRPDGPPLTPHKA